MINSKQKTNSHRSRYVSAATTVCRRSVIIAATRIVRIATTVLLQMVKWIRWTRDAEKIGELEVEVLEGMEAVEAPGEAVVEDEPLVGAGAVQAEVEDVDLRLEPAAVFRVGVVHLVDVVNLVDAVLHDGEVPVNAVTVADVA